MRSSPFWEQHAVTCRQLLPADAASIGITQAGRRLRHAAHHTAGRKLNNLVLPQINLPDPLVPLPFVTVTSSSNNGVNVNDDYTATTPGDGSSASSSSSSGGGGRVAVASIECTVPVEQLYIPSA